MCNETFNHNTLIGFNAFQSGFKVSLSQFTFQVVFNVNYVYYPP